MYILSAIETYYFSETALRLCFYLVNECVCVYLVRCRKTYMYMGKSPPHELGRGREYVFKISGIY